MVYEITGVYPAPSFFSIKTLNDGTGRIELAQSLTKDSLQLAKYQLNILAYDSSYPNKKATATLVVSVRRNVNGPEFQPSSSYSKTIVESFVVGDNILQVKAVDKDVSVSYLSYSLI